MAAPQSSTVLGVFSLDEGSREVIEEFARAVSRLTDRGTDATPEPSLPDPYVSAWPIRSHPPLIIATCPHCGSSIEANPVIWEIVVDPTSTLGATSVRGQMQHQHDGDVLVRWPFAATFNPAPDLIEAKVVDEREAWLDEGRASVEIGETLTFDREDEAVDEAVFLALGAASMCWEEEGVFDSERAVGLGATLLSRIERHIDERVQAAEDERVRLEQIIYRARTSVREIRERNTVTPNNLALVADLLAAVDGIDSPAAKRLRGDS